MALSAPVRLVSQQDSLVPTQGGEIFLLPNYLAQIALPGEHFDLVVNTLSLSEMSAHQVVVYGSLISKAIGVAGHFFEQNHDNRPVGLLDCREYLSPFFRTMNPVESGKMPTTRGTAVVWSNLPE